MSKKRERKPEWLAEIKKRMSLVEVLDMAWSSEYTDKQVRQALKDITEDLGDVMKASGGMPDQ